MSDFFEKGLDEAIQLARFQHYRKNKIKAIKLIMECIESTAPNNNDIKYATTRTNTNNNFIFGMTINESPKKSINQDTFHLLSLDKN